MPLFLFNDTSMTGKNTILFDGYCNLCSWSVQFLIKQDVNNIFEFFPIDSEKGRDIIQDLSPELKNVDSIILVTENAFFIKSEAVLSALDHIGGVWKLVKILRILPKSLLDLIYDFIAKYRYKIFGKRNVCYFPESNPGKSNN